MTVAIVASCVTVERSIPWRQQGAPAPGAIDHIAQITALFLAAGVGAGTLAVAAAPEWTALLLFAHAFLWIVSCAVVREAEYRWTTLFALAGSATYLAAQQRAAHPDAGVTLIIAGAGVFLALLCAVWLFVPKRAPDDRARPIAGK
ncbi:MAG: hypothetical protein FJY92_11230 [Candidatus Hydrogenedentes bacterium]|nr:hypothetical protein [Candidatus Hydrogenedentota bacterium]